MKEVVKENKLTDVIEVRKTDYSCRNSVRGIHADSMLGNPNFIKTPAFPKKK